MPKFSYRVKNWKRYNEALINRGSLTIWIDEAAIGDWISMTPSIRRGRPYTYSAAAIETCLTLRTLGQLPLRMAQGLMRSIFGLMQINLPVPNYTTLCRRGVRLDYHRRSLAETGMYRQKQILGNRLKSINFAQQTTEARIRASILNKMTRLGMPQSYRIS